MRCVQSQSIDLGRHFLDYILPWRSSSAALRNEGSILYMQSKISLEQPLQSVWPAEYQTHDTLNLFEAALSLVQGSGKHIIHCSVTFMPMVLRYWIFTVIAQLPSTNGCHIAGHFRLSLEYICSHCKYCHNLCAQLSPEQIVAQEPESSYHADE